MKNKKAFLVLLIMFFLLSGCKKKEEKTVVINEPEEKIVYDELPVDNVVQYFINLDFYATLAYDDGKCTGDYVKDNKCTFTLNQLKELVSYEDLTGLDYYKSIACDGDKISVTIDLSKSNNDGISTTHSVDEICMPDETVE